MINVIQIHDSLLVDQANVSIPYTAETVAFNKPQQRNSQPFSALKQGKFRRLFNRHHPALGYR